MPDRIALDSNEIEVACDLLWFVKLKGEWSPVDVTLWERLQPIRHGDFGGTAATDVSALEATAIVAAGDFTHPRVELDEDEDALVTRLRSLLAAR